MRSRSEKEENRKFLFRIRCDARLFQDEPEWLNTALETRENEFSSSSVLQPKSEECWEEKAMSRRPFRFGIAALGAGSFPF